MCENKWQYTWHNTLQHLPAFSRDEGNANAIIKLSQTVWNIDLDKQWMAFRQISSNELCETEWIKQNNSSQWKFKMEEGQRVKTLFQEPFTNENLGDFTSKNGLFSWILSKSFSKQPLDPKIQGTVKIQKGIQDPDIFGQWNIQCNMEMRNRK